MSTHYIILNPHAGRGVAGKRRGELERMLQQAGITFDLATTHARGGATELTHQALERGYTRIVAVGGDGTINEIVNGMMGSRQRGESRAALAIVPLGTGSDFIKVLDGVLPDDLTSAVQRLVTGQTRLVDVGKLKIRNAFQETSRFFINGANMGVDAQVAVESLKIKRISGKMVYLLAIMRALAHYKAYPMSVQFDDQQVYKRLLFTSVANGRSQGGGFWMTPDALIDDGMLDLCMVDNLRIDQIARYLPRLMRGTHTHLWCVTMGQGRHFTVECDAPFPVSVDGEVAATDALYAEIDVYPKAIEVIA